MWAWLGAKANLGNSFPDAVQCENSSDQLIKSGMFGTVKMDGNNLLTDKVIIRRQPLLVQISNRRCILPKTTRLICRIIIIEERVGDQVIVSGLSVGDILIIGGFHQPSWRSRNKNQLNKKYGAKNINRTPHVGYCAFQCADFAGSNRILEFKLRIASGLQSACSSNQNGLSPGPTPPKLKALFLRKLGK